MSLFVLLLWERILPQSENESQSPHFQRMSPNATGLKGQSRSPRDKRTVAYVNCQSRETSLISEHPIGWSSQAKTSSRDKISLEKQSEICRNLSRRERMRFHTKLITLAAVSRVTLSVFSAYTEPYKLHYHNTHYLVI